MDRIGRFILPRQRAEMALKLLSVLDLKIQATAVLGSDGEEIRKEHFQEARKQFKKTQLDVTTIDYMEKTIQDNPAIIRELITAIREINGLVQTKAMDATAEVNTKTSSELKCSTSVVETPTSSSNIEELIRLLASSNAKGTQKTAATIPSSLIKDAFLEVLADTEEVLKEAKIITNKKGSKTMEPKEKQAKLAESDKKAFSEQLIDLFKSLDSEMAKLSQPKALERIRTMMANGAIRARSTAVVRGDVDLTTGLQNGENAASPLSSDISKVEESKTNVTTSTKSVQAQATANIRTKHYTPVGRLQYLDESPVMSLDMGIVFSAEEQLALTPELLTDGKKSLEEDSRDSISLARQERGSSQFSSDYSLVAPKSLTRTVHAKSASASSTHEVVELYSTTDMKEFLAAAEKTMSDLNKTQKSTASKKMLF